MGTLTRRVQVMLSPQQYERLETLARARGVSVGALIRQAIQEAFLQPDEAERMRAVQDLAALRLPVAGWEQMERESMPGNALG